MRATRIVASRDAARAGFDAHSGASAEHIIATIAGRQHGVVSRRQLLAAGVPAHVIDDAVHRLRLVILYRGVYRVGPVAAPHAPAMAAVLACGDGAVLSHATAAAAWQIAPPRPPSAPIDVSTRTTHRAPGPSVRLHRTGTSRPDERTVLDGIPTTAPISTLLDLSGTVDDRRLEQALAAAIRRGIVTTAELRRLLEARARRPGTARLRALLDHADEPALTRSEAEELLLRLPRSARLPMPKTNALIVGVEADFVWRGARLVVDTRVRRTPRRVHFTAIRSPWFGRHPHCRSRGPVGTPRPPPPPGPPHPHPSPLHLRLGPTSAPIAPTRPVRRVGPVRRAPRFPTLPPDTARAGRGSFTLRRRAGSCVSCFGPLAPRSPADHSPRHAPPRRRWG